MLAAAVVGYLRWPLTGWARVAAAAAGVALLTQGLVGDALGLMLALSVATLGGTREARAA
jgi:TRAP-type uncharacterized transport system fused permease subunit